MNILALETCGQSTNAIVNSALDIQDVRIEGQRAQWDLGAKFEPYGNPLSIQVPNKQGDGVLLDVRVAMYAQAISLTM